MLKRSLIGSAALHAAVIAAATFVWPHQAPDFADESPPPIPVDLVDIADVSNIKPIVVERREPDITTPQQLAVLEPAFQPVAPPPLDEVEVAPEPEKPPPPPEEPKPEPKKPEPPPEPPKVAEKPKPVVPEHPALPRRKPQPDQPKFDVDSVLALLDKRAPKAPPQPKQADLGQKTIKGLGAENAMTLDLKDALLSQMRECWNVPVGAPNPEKLIVQVRVFLAQDGRLAQPPRLEPGSRAAAAVDPYMRTAAEAALRAVNVCEPYKRLPPERYDTWREIVMTFDPSKMLGR